MNLKLNLLSLLITFNWLIILFNCLNVPHKQYLFFFFQFLLSPVPILIILDKYVLPPIKKENGKGMETCFSTLLSSPVLKNKLCSLYLLNF